MEKWKKLRRKRKEEEKLIGNKRLKGKIKVYV
jgi:hypothetical protein